MAKPDEDDDDLSEATLTGDLRRDTWPAEDAPRANAYLGNGRFGGCFDAYGLQNGGGLGATVLMHADHRRSTNEFLPLARWKWAGDAPLNGAPAPAYEQALRLNHGWLFTEMNWGGLDLAVVGLFHPVQRDLFVLSIDYTCAGSKTVPPLLLAPAGKFDCKACDEKKNTAHLQIRDGDVSTDLLLRVVSDEGRVKVQSDADGIKISFAGREGRHLFLLGAATSSRADQLAETMANLGPTDALLRDGIEAWQKHWSAGGVELSDPAQQALYERSLYMLLCSSDGQSAFPAHGWTGNGALVPNPATDGEVQGIYNTLGLDALLQTNPPFGGIAARNIDEFLSVAKTDAESFQFFDANGAPYSLAAHAVFINTVHATLLGAYHNMQTQAWPVSWDAAAFENLRMADGTLLSARNENGSWSELA